MQIEISSQNYLIWRTLPGRNEKYSHKYETTSHDDKKAFELELELNELAKGSAIDLSCHYD